MDEASLSPDGNELKKYQQSKSSTVQSLPLPSSSEEPSDEPSDNLTAVNKISVDLRGYCNQPCDIP